MWEVDEFIDENAGLVVAEIELTSADETFVLPDWAGREVTNAQRYYNRVLATRPFVASSATQRHADDVQRLKPRGWRD